MAKLVVVIGLPGSGKTTYMTSLKAKKIITAFYDDYQGKSYGHNKDPRLSRCYSPMLYRLTKGEAVAVADIRYCLEPELNKLLAAILDVVPYIEVELHYFENNPTACSRNIKRQRPKDRVERELKIIADWSPQYRPKKPYLLEVYSPQ